MLLNMYLLASNTCPVLDCFIHLALSIQLTCYMYLLVSNMCSRVQTTLFIWAVYSAHSLHILTTVATATCAWHSGMLYSFGLCLFSSLATYTHQLYTVTCALRQNALFIWVLSIQLTHYIYLLTTGCSNMCLVLSDCSIHLAL